MQDVQEIREHGGVTTLFSRPGASAGVAEVATGAWDIHQVPVDQAGYGLAPPPWPAEEAAGGALGGSGRLAAAQGRDQLVQLRLSNLLAVLGAQPSAPQPLRVYERGHSLARLLAPAIAQGAVLLSGRYLPGRAVALGCVVVAPRGVVVVDVVPGGRCAGRAREALRRAMALRSWWEGAHWSEIPVLAAVCSLEEGLDGDIGPGGALPVVLDRLWLGTTASLSSWLMADGPLSAATCQAVGAFLDAQLPD